MSCGVTFQFDGTNGQGPKDPQSDIDFRFEWGPWLDGDTIASSSWTVQSGSGLTMHNDSVVGTDTIVWLAGGNVADVSWKVTNTITTAAGRTDERTIAIKVENR